MTSLPPLSGDDPTCRKRISMISEPPEADDVTPEAVADAWHRILADACEDQRVVSVRLKSGSLHAGRIVDVGPTTFGLEEKKDGDWFDHVIALTEVAAIVWKRAEE